MTLLSVHAHILPLTAGGAPSHHFDVFPAPAQLITHTTFYILMTEKNSNHQNQKVIF
jgi:hypothetical protein